MSIVAKAFVALCSVALISACSEGGDHAQLPRAQVANSTPMARILTDGTNGTFQKPTDWNYKDEVYDSNRTGYEPTCDSACNGQVADGLTKKCRFGDYCDGIDSTPYHTGIDYQDANGSDDVRAAAVGKVVRIVQNGSDDHALGNVVILKHYCVVKEECSAGGTVYTLYAHMASIDGSISIGDWVQQGRKLGAIGGTGSGQTNRWPKHLHFELKQAPVLFEASSKESCMYIKHTVVLWKIPTPFTYLDVAYGYSPQSNPVNCGYFDPERFIGRVAVKDLSGDTMPTDPADGVDGEYGIVGFGYAYLDMAEQEVQQTPDFVVKKVWLQTPWGSEVYRVGLGESFDTKAQSTNIGDGPCLPTDPVQTIPGHFYLSKGYKEDAHSGDGAWRRIDSTTTQCDNLKPGDTNTETKNTKISDWITTPGIYNIVYCIDHPLDDHNNGGEHLEKHESNNCSTEAVFEVTANQIENVPNVDLAVSNLTILQIPVYAGDYIRLGAWIKNQGTVNATTDIRSSYTVSCNGAPSAMLTDDGTTASTLVAGASAWEEILTPVLMPNVSGTCTLTFTADYLGSQPETDETNNSQSITVTLLPRPAPNLVITRFEDKVGCCTTNTGAAPKPRIWIRNDGSIAPGANVLVAYQVCSPATGNLCQVIGYGTIEPRELAPGDTDEDQMDCDGCWRIPKSNAWKKQWHTFRACLRQDGGMPVPTTGEPSPGEVCAVYQRYSKE